jgi:hypothetical protein
MPIGSLINLMTGKAALRGLYLQPALVAGRARRSSSGNSGFIVCELGATTRRKSQRSTDSCHAIHLFLETLSFGESDCVMIATCFRWKN